ncbi:MAG: DUF3800 domain-containing protein [Hyphomicrobiaceae bacterium]
MAYSDYIVYVDESGDHSLDSIDPNYPMFVLAFCIFRKVDYVAQVSPSIQRFKFEHYGHDSVVLHEHAIRKQLQPFTFLKSRVKRERFLDGLSNVVQAAPMTIIAAVIHKERHAQRYVRPDNPYEIALLFCMERLFAFLRDQGDAENITHVVVECRGKKEDAALELEFRRIKDGANRWGRLPCLEIAFCDKKANSAGLQIADLIARPIGLQVLRPQQENRAYEIIEPKFRRNPRGNFIGWGFKIFP